MKPILTNIVVDAIRENDRFIVTKIDDCGNIFLHKTTSNTSPCPKWVNVYVNWISGNIPSWCYDGSEFFIWWDTDLVPENIKSWINIFDVVGTYNWVPITWTSQSFWDNIASWTINAWVYNGAQVVSFSSSTLSPSNVKMWTSIFWTSGAYKQLPIPSVFTDVWMHTWVTHETNNQTEYRIWAISDTNNLYLCYAMAYKQDPLITYYRNVVMRINSWVMTKILDDSWTLNYSWSALWFSFRYWSGSDEFIVREDKTSWTYSYKTITISTWAVSWTLTTATAPNAEINQSIYFGNKKYKPVITPTSITHAYSSPLWKVTNPWLSLNINTTDF